MPRPRPAFVTVQELAQHIGATRAWLMREARAKRIPSLEVSGGGLRFCIDDVRAALLARSRGEAAAEAGS